MHTFTYAKRLSKEKKFSEMKKTALERLNTFKPEQTLDFNNVSICFFFLLQRNEYECLLNERTLLLYYLCYGWCWCWFAPNGVNVTLETKKKTQCVPTSLFNMFCWCILFSFVCSIKYAQLLCTIFDKCHCIYGVSVQFICVNRLCMRIRLT